MDALRLPRRSAAGGCSSCTSHLLGPIHEESSVSLVWFSPSLVGPLESRKQAEAGPFRQHGCGGASKLGGSAT